MRPAATHPAASDLLGEVRRHLFVALELHLEVGAAAADRAQVGRVVEHLGHRHLGLDLGRRALRLHPQRVAAARVEVADHVADDVLGAADVSRTIGSSRTGSASSIACLKAIEPAILKAISEESTSWCLPSTSRTRTSLTG